MSDAQGQTVRKEAAIAIERSFPAEKDDVILSQPARINVCGHDLIVSDVQQSALFRYTTEGEFKEMLRSPGQGPTDFLLTSSFACSHNRIFIVDHSNFRIQMFDMDFNHIDSFLIPAMVGNDAVATSSSLFLGDLRTVGSGAISEYAYDGTPKSRAGEYISVAPSELRRLLTRYRFALSNDSLFALSLHYPQILVIDLQTRAEKLVDLDGPDYSDRAEGNYTWSKFKPDSRVISTTYLFRALAVADEGIYVGIYSRSGLIIDLFTRSGSFVQRFTSAKLRNLDGFYLTDFTLGPVADGRRTLYVVSNNPFPQVSVVSVPVVGVDSISK